MSPSLFLALAGLLLLAAPAAAQTKVDLDGSLSPLIREVPKRPPSMTLRMEAHFSGDKPPSNLPPILDRSVIHFPYGSALNSRLFPSCAPAIIDRRGPRACPRLSRIGAGRAIGVGDDVVQRIRVTLYNGRGGRSVVFHLVGNNPLRINTAFNAPIVRLRGGRWNYRLTIPVPESLQVVAGVELALREFVSTVRATRRVRGRSRGYIEAWACPPGARVPLRGLFQFLDEAPVTVNSWIGCA
jgi:hypothetical protein